MHIMLLGKTKPSLHIKTHFSASSPPQCSVDPKHLCALAHLRYIREVGASK